MRCQPALHWLSVTLLLGGCSLLSPFGAEDDPPTVGSLAPSDLPETGAIEASDSREAAMRHYEAFLIEAPDNAFVPEAMRRLADLHLSREQDALMAGTALPASQSRAAELYAELLQRFPDHQRNDSALYQLARAHEQGGDPEPSMQALTSYSDTYRSGDKYDEVQFRRGEYLFVRRDYSRAEQAYQAVIAQGKQSTFYRQALYKLGWARFKQNGYEPALNAYVQLLDQIIASHDTAALPDSLPRAEQERIDDTLRAVSLSFSYLGANSEIRDYFRRHGKRSYEPLLYAKLAALHLSKERFTDAAETYSLFADVHPQHREAPLFQSRVIDVYKQAGFSERVLEEKQAFIERYEPASRYWKQHDPAKSPDVMAQVQRHLRDVARHYHALAQQQNKQPVYAEAGRWYRLYLNAFPKSEQAPLMNFLYAELLTSSAQHGAAASEYERTAYAYGQHDKAAEAGYAALLAYQKHEPTLTGHSKAEWHRAGIDSALRFATEFPHHKQALPVRTRAAQQLYALKDHTAAIAAAQPVTESGAAPGAMQLSAWTVIAHAQFDLQDYQRAESAYQQVLARSGRSDEQYEKLQEKLAASIYKQGEQEKLAGNLSAAADHFLRIADAVPTSNVNTTAQYDAAAAYIALKRWPEAIAILERWRRSNPEHKLQADVTRKLAVLYQENSQPLRAAGEFERIAGSEKDPSLRREAAWTTATLYQQSGRDRQSIDAYRRFVEQFPRPMEQAMEARYQLVQLYGKSNDAGKQRFWRQQIVEAERTAGPDRTDRTRFLAAHARLALVAGDYAAYKSVKLREPLKDSLARKKKFMKATVKGYNEAAAYQVSAVTTEATFRIGQVYADFGQALVASERPRNLNSEELEQYEILLEEQAYPFEEKAIEVHEANAQRIAGGIYDSWVRRSMATLAELMPARYAKEERSENFVAILQ
jgi:tetratricopeptide (TPR) repeat protein